MQYLNGSFGSPSSGAEVKTSPIDQHLSLLLHNKTTFDFIMALSRGKTLLVGEGNLSFALSLAKMPQLSPSAITATTFEAANKLSPETEVRAKELQRRRVRVLHGVNAVRLTDALSAESFEQIVFQFPHTGSREPIRGRNPNYILVRDFLKSAKLLLQRNGKILISAVDNPHYRGAFQFEEAAILAGCDVESYPFDPNDFPGYQHTMTHEEGGAIDEHEVFNTWVFRPIE